MNTDSLAARSISSRRGAGRVRHVEVRELWVQERVRRGELSINKVRGEDNVADGLTKHVERRRSAGSQGMKGDVSSALTSETFESSSRFSLDEFVFPFLQPWHIHELQCWITVGAVCWSKEQTLE